MAKYTSSTSTISGTYTLQHSGDATAAYDNMSISLGGIDPTVGDMSWQFQIKHTNTASSTNGWIVFLYADADASQMLNSGGNINGYALGVNTGSTFDDIVKLYSVTNGSYTSILASSLNWDTGRTSTNDTLGVRITRSMAGEWEVFFDTQSGGFNNLVSVGTTTNTTHTNAAYFGVLYKYTSANIRKFWFDDLSITGTISTSAITANTAAIPAASLPQNAQNIVVGGFRISVTGKNTTLNEVNFIPSGTFGSDDITNLQLWYSSDSIFDASDVLLDETTNIVSGSPISFSGLSKIFSKNNTAYILITADVDPHAIANHTFFFENTVPGDLVFSEGSLTENYVASNTFTIEDVVVETLELTTGFENSDLWTDFSYSDFTVNSVQGVWTGKGISASSTFKYTGLRGVSFNTLGDYLEFPPINNPGKIEFDSKLSSDGTADLNRLAVQVLIGANWVNIHDIQQSTSTWQHNTIYIHQKGTNLRLRLYKNSYEKTQYIDNIIVKSIEHAYDTSSIAEVPVNQPVSQNISSLKDTPVEAIHVFSFNLTDNALTDTKSTKIRMLEIRNKKPVGTAIWDATIQGVRLYADGNEIVTSSLLVSDTSLLISFVNDDLVINSGQTRELDLYIYLKDTGIEKGATLQFCIPATGFSFASDTSGSAFNTSIPAEIVSEIHTLSVIGSQLQILSQTQQTGLSSPFGIKTAITDVNGNIDTAASGQISLGLLSGASGILTSALNPLLNLPTNNGIAEWTDLAYNTFDTIQLQVNTNIAGITTITSLPIVIGDVDSEIGAPTVQIASQDVSSVADSVHEKVPIFRFNVTDTGASGGVSTFIQEFYFKNTMPYNGADWTNSIQGAVIEDGDSVYFPSDVVINDNYLKLTYTTPIEIENDSNKDFELAIYLNKSKIIDNSRIQFYIDSVDYNWKAIQGSALLDILPAKVFSNISTLRVISDTLLFANVPDTAYTNTYFSADITATDKNLNIDTDADALVTLSQCVGTDLLAAGEGLVKRLSSGVFQWRYLLLDSPGERGLSASASGYKTGLTDTFIVLGENLSDILPALSPIGNQNISSLADSRTEATEVFRFRVSDAGLNDDATTSVTKMRFVPGSANSANWTLNVADAFIMHNADTLVHSIISIHDDALIFEFTDFPVEIPSGQTEAFSLYIVLKSNGIQDGKTLQFKIPSVYHEWDTELYTSIFRTNLSADVISPESLIDVIGNQIAILNKPNFIPVDSSFSLSVSYTDANLNLDEDAVEQISISKASLGAGNFEIEIPYTSSINFENGIANFQGLRYNTQDTLSLNFSTFSGTSLNEQVFICGKFYLDENFNLGNFNKWNSDTTEWIIPNTANPYAKHGLSNVAGKSHLATNLFGYVQGNGLTHWEFSIYTGNWNPSSLNKFNFFLLADNTNLELAQNGFAFGINNHNTSGLLSLIELKDGISTLLFETNYTWQVSDSVNFQIEYNPVGIWKLQYKAKNDTEWNTIENIRGKITDDFAATGLLFEYTSTRAGYLGLDDLKVIQINYPPALLEVKANALDTVKLIFSEKLLESDAENIAHYTIKNFDNDIISVNQVVLNPTNEKEITLITDSLGYTPLELIISQISDIESTLAYNIIDTFSLPYRPMAHRLWNI